MSDDLGKKVQQIAQMLGQENAPDNLKELLALLAASLERKEEDAGQAASSDSDIPEKSSNTDTVINANIQDTARKALNKLNTESDPRVNLLHAIKPFMNSKRQKKIGSCIQLLQVASLSRLFNEREK